MAVIQRVEPKYAQINGELLSAFLADLELAGKSHHTLVNYRCDLQGFFRWFKKPCTATCPDDLRGYFHTVKHLSPASVARKQASLKRFFQWCIQQELMARNPMDRIERIRPPEKLPRPLEEATVRRILDAIPPQALRDRLLFTLILETGLRVSEALNIYVEDLMLAPDDEKIFIRSGKGGKSRTVMLYAAPDTLRLLKKFLARSGIRSGALFRGSEARGGGSFPMHYRSVHHLWNKYCSKAGVKASIHMLRHTFATQLLNEGVHVTVVKKLLGHKSLQTTMRYTDVTDQFIKAELMQKHRRR